MAVERISEKALHQILSGPTNPATCVIKFYSNGCDYCHALSSYYKEIAETYTDLYFFAFNIDDSPKIVDILGINGVPTIGLINTGAKNARLRILDDPENPNKKTWYTVKYIKQFIEKEKE